MKYYERLHPFVAFIYFILIIFISMFTVNPVLLAISFVSSFVFFVVLSRKKTRQVIKELISSLLIILIIGIINPLFSHRGNTILFKFGSLNFTLESITSGLSIGAMLLSVIYWFKSYNLVIISDKFNYLFGRVIPKLSLIISVTLGLIPKYKKYYQEIDDSQRALGVYSKSFIGKIKNKLGTLSILITFCLENSIETADTMRARGYELKHHQSYNIYCWNRRDIISLIFFVAFGGLTLGLLFANFSDYNFYPTLDKIILNKESLIVYISFFIFSVSSIILEVKENILWHYLRSKI